MLRRLSGRTHRVDTGVALVTSKGEDVFSTASLVTFRPLIPVTETLIDRYAESGLPLDKAGAYGIQELGGLLIERIAGDSSLSWACRCKGSRTLQTYGPRAVDRLPAPFVAQKRDPIPSLLREGVPDEPLTVCLVQQGHQRFGIHDHAILVGDVVERGPVLGLVPGRDTIGSDHHLVTFGKTVVYRILDTDLGHGAGDNQGIHCLTLQDVLQVGVAKANNCTFR